MIDVFPYMSFIACFTIGVRSDDEDDDYHVYRSDSESRHYCFDNDYYGTANADEIGTYGLGEVNHDGENTDGKNLAFADSFGNSVMQGMENVKEHDLEVPEGFNGEDCEAHPYDIEGTDYEPVDFENEGLLWIPPEPADEEDEREAILFDDDEDDGAAGEWGYLRSTNSFGSGEYRSRDRSSEEHRKAMKYVVEGHFRALVAQLLQVENLPDSDEHDRESWLEIITSLSWEAATLLKPDTSKGGGMDPGGYVKVKCIACGHRSER